MIAISWVRLANRFAWVNMAPLESPVVPPVYCNKAMVS